jgi:septal ring factor EnvC (AmiA/AmiB activator)
MNKKEVNNYIKDLSDMDIVKNEIKALNQIIASKDNVIASMSKDFSSMSKDFATVKKALAAKEKENAELRRRLKMN